MSELLLQTKLEEIRNILERHKVQFWPAFLAERERQLLAAYSSGHKGTKLKVLEDLEMLYGGMGSFNDLVISKEGGHDITTKDAPNVNEKINKIRTQLYQMIQEEKTRLEQMSP